MQSVQKIGLVILVAMTGGCGAIRSMEQWKCDNWGMCHFAPRKPGVYTPMAVQPGYAPPGYVPPGYPNGNPAATSVMPPGYPGTAAPLPSANVPAYGYSAPSPRPANPNCQSCSQ
ncbi:MAG: hypothetical protein WCI02_03790 [Planctomycetota bacterium]